MRTPVARQKIPRILATGYREAVVFVLVFGLWILLLVFWGVIHRKGGTINQEHMSIAPEKSI
jgi:hypothetical protein